MRVLTASEHLLAVATEKAVEVWDRRTRERVQRVALTNVADLAFHQGDLYALLREKSLVRIEGEEAFQELELPARGKGLLSAPEGLYLALVDRLLCWDGELETVYEGRLHGGPVAVPGGVAVGTADGVAVLREEVVEREGPPQVTQLAWRDGEGLYAGGAGGEVLLHDLEAEAEAVRVRPPGTTLYDRAPGVISALTCEGIVPIGDGAVLTSVTDGPNRLFRPGQEKLQDTPAGLMFRGPVHHHGNHTFVAGHDGVVEIVGGRPADDGLQRSASVLIALGGDRWFASDAFRHLEGAGNRVVSTDETRRTPRYRLGESTLAVDAGKVEIAGQTYDASELRIPDDRSCVLVDHGIAKGWQVVEHDGTLRRTIEAGDAIDARGDQLLIALKDELVWVREGAEVRLPLPGPACPPWRRTHTHWVALLDASALVGTHAGVFQIQPDGTVLRQWVPIFRRAAVHPDGVRYCLLGTDDATQVGPDGGLRSHPAPGVRHALYLDDGSLLLACSMGALARVAP